MSLTRAAVETILIARCGTLLTAAGLAYALPSPIDALNDPIGYALRQLGHSVANVTAVTDTDVSAIADTEYDALFDLSEARLLQNILGNFDGVDTTVGPRREVLSQLRDGIEMRLDKLQARIERDYGIGGGSLQAGTIELDFVDHNEDRA
jgi:hypothetical protein